MARLVNVAVNRASRYNRATPCGRLVIAAADGAGWCNRATPVGDGRGLRIVGLLPEEEGAFEALFEVEEEPVYFAAIVAIFKISTITSEGRMAQGI